MRVHVQGGTGAGSRTPFNGKAEPWECRCWVTVFTAQSGGISTSGPWKAKLNIGALAACPDCGMRRPT